MPNKQNLVLVVDVETCGALGDSKVYDFGFAVVEPKTGNIIESHSLVIPEVFYGLQEEMQSAYYSGKLPQYVAGIESGVWTLSPFWKTWNLVRDTMRKYGITKVFAYNCKFDKDALNNTMRVISANRFRNFFPKGTQFCDIWHMACQTIMSQRNFVKFCNKNGFVSDAGNLRTSAEICYAYITKNATFEEAHTGMEDVVIEAAILRHIYRQKKRVSEKIVPNPWKIPQKVRKEVESRQMTLY
jgi:hypothetical protein